MELRQLRYFVTLAEELHFGRAAERELGVRLLERSTHHVELTLAGVAFLVEARHILVHVERAAQAARSAVEQSSTLRVGIVDPGYDSMPLILHEVRRLFPDLEIHQIESTVPEQYAQLVDGSMDVGFGRASLAPAEVSSELFRLDPMGVVVAEDHPFTALPGVQVQMLEYEPLLLEEEKRAPEFTRFLVELCRTAGFRPLVYSGTVQSIQAGVHLVKQEQCVLCVPSSCKLAADGVVWKPLIDPISCYPWSVLWRTENRSPFVRAVVASARALAREQGWLEPPEPPEAVPEHSVAGE